MKIANIILGGLAALVMGSCASEAGSPAYCSKDTECKVDRICVQGICVDNGSGEGSSVKYTCESGVQMYANLCCNNKGICSIKIGDNTYKEFISECNEDLNKEKGNYSEWVDFFFQCVNNVCINVNNPNNGGCSTSVYPVRDKNQNECVVKLNACENNYWP